MTFEHPVPSRATPAAGAGSRAQHPEVAGRVQQPQGPGAWWQPHTLV